MQLPAHAIRVVLSGEVDAEDDDSLNLAPAGERRTRLTPAEIQEQERREARRRRREDKRRRLAFYQARGM